MEYTQINTNKHTPKHPMKIAMSMKRAVYQIKLSFKSITWF